MRRREHHAYRQCCGVANYGTCPADKSAQVRDPSRRKSRTIFRQFSEGLREFGYIDGQNIRVEVRSAEGKLNLLPGLAEELVRLKVDIIVASETPSVQAAKHATSEIPIVMAPSGDRVDFNYLGSA